MLVSSACSLPIFGLQHTVRVWVGPRTLLLSEHIVGVNAGSASNLRNRRESLARSLWGRAAVGLGKREPIDTDSTEWEQPFRLAAPALSTLPVDKWWIHLVRYVSTTVVQAPLCYAKAVAAPLCRPGGYFTCHRASSCDRT
jgi:hypothetical protein